MKIAEYNDMMAYLTRTGFKDGTEKIAEPPKSMQMDTTTSNPIPEYDITDFRNDAEIFVLAYHNNILPTSDIANRLNAFAQKGIDAGTFTMQEAADAVKDLKFYVKDRAQKQRLRDVVPEGIGTVDRDNLAPGGRPRLEIPGLEDEIKKLFNQGLSTNQVLKNLKQNPEFEKVSEGVVKRVKKEFNLGAKSADLLSSQADKYNKLKELIEQSNNQLKFVDLRTLRERVGLPRKAAPTDKANMEKFNVPKLDSAQDKVRKGFQKIISNPNVPVEEVFDISTKIGQSTNLSPASVSQFLQDIPEYQDFKPTALKLQSPSFKGLIAGQGRTLSDVMDIADQIPETTGTSLTGPNTPERFIINSVKRHIAQNGDKVEWVKAPGTFDELGKVTEGRSVFRYKGKDYSYLDLAQNGRNMKEFKEVYEMYDDMDKLLSREVVNPVTNEKTTFKNLMNEAYAKGTGYETIKNPLEIDHFGSVKKEPFSNLRILPYRINRAAGTITKTARDAEKGFVTKQGDKWTPAKSKIYLQKSGYNFPKDPNKLFKDEIKLANDILVKGRKLRTPVEIGVEAAEKKFKGLLNLEGVTTASQIDRPQSALDRESFKRFNEKFKPRGMSLGAMGDIPMAKEILAKDFEKLKTIFGSKAARQIAGTTLKGAGSVYPFEMLFMGDMQQQGLSPKEMALDIGTLGVGTIFKDIKEKFDYVKSKGLGDELQSAFRKQTINQQARPALGGVEGMFQEQTLTPDEEAALRAYNLDAQNIIDMRRSYQADEYKKTDEAFGFDDPIMRGGAMDGGIMRLGFADGPEDPSKRKFMKILGGLTALPFVGKFFKTAEPIAKVAPKIVETAKGVPPYFFKLVDKIKKLGEDATKQLKGAEREQVTVYRTSDADYELYEDLNTGSQQIKIRKGDPDGGYKEQELTLTKGQSDETAGVVPDDYDEYTVRPDNDGKLKDIEEGLDDIDDLIDELGPENISVKELQDMGYDVDRLGPVTKKKLGIK